MIRLKEVRVEKGLSQVNVSSSIGRNNKSYSCYELEQRQMDYETLIAVADFFDVSIDYLLGRTENKRFLASMDENENGFICSKDEKELIKSYRQLNNEQKQYIRGVITGVSSSLSSPNKKAVVFPATAGISRKNIKDSVKKEV